MNQGVIQRCAVKYCALCLLFFFCNFLVGQRLPKTVFPDHYKLSIDANIGERRFSGEETIDVKVTQPVKEISLNSLGLVIELAEVTSSGTTQAARVNYDKAAEMAQLTFEHPVTGGAELHLKFAAPLTESLRGLYLSKSSRRSYAVTQFEGTYARMMFPSFDEPAFKATFDLTVTADKGDTAISNGQITSDGPIEGGKRHRITFGTSPKMSTYLLAVAIGDWACLERNADGVPIRVCAVPEKKEQGRFALEVAARSVEFYNKWYGMRYPFGKLDMVAIPDYEWGGMENTASIFYRDSALLMDESKASVFAQRGHATVIAHEIAHQWFGDLVTAAWWDDIWLNEGFASWMERKPIEAWHPEWHLENDEASSAQEVIGLDSLVSARAIHGDPGTSAEIKEMFDGISYEKGAAVLRMLEAYVGPEVFRAGVNQYLKEHANGNAQAADFWRVMAKVSGKPVDKIMPGFVMQAGVPLVKVSGSCRGDAVALALEQQRFLISPPAKVPAAGEAWQIPVCLKTDNQEAATCQLMKDIQHEVAIKGCPAWIFANANANGYYRVQYEPQMLEKIAKTAERDLNTAERIALVEDTWAMVRAGRYPAGGFMNVASAMRAEHESAVVNFLAGHMRAAGSLAPNEQREKYAAIVASQFVPLARELGWTAKSGDSDEQKVMRASLMQILGDAGDPGAVTAARKIVAEHLKDPGATDGTITGAAFAVAARNGDAKLYEILRAAWNKATSSEEYNLYLYALAGFRQPDLMQRTLALASDGKLRQQDYPGFFGALLGNPASRSAAWSYLKSHWDELAEKVTSFGGRGAVSALGSFCSIEERDDVKEFFAAHKAPGAERALRQSLERIDSCIEFKDLQGGNMEKWLSER